MKKKIILGVATTFSLLIHQIQFAQACGPLNDEDHHKKSTTSKPTQQSQQQYLTEKGWFGAGIGAKKAGYDPKTGAFSVEEPNAWVACAKPMYLLTLGVLGAAYFVNLYFNYQHNQNKNNYLVEDNDRLFIRH